MAPLLESVYNVSGKDSVHVEIGGKSFDIDNDESQPINRRIPTDAYMKIYVDHEEDQAYLLKYVLPNIKLNDPLGKINGVPDSAVRMDFSDKNIRISMFPSEMHISCDGKFLGIYQPDGSPIYYSSIVARHDLHAGGIIVTGGANSEEEGEVKEA